MYGRVSEYLASGESGSRMTMTRTDPSEVPTYRHLDNSNSPRAGKLSAKRTEVTPSPSTTQSRLFTLELLDLESELSSAELPVPTWLSLL